MPSTPSAPIAQPPALQQHLMQQDETPQRTALSSPPPATLSPPPPAHKNHCAQEDVIKEEPKLTSPVLSPYAVKSPTNLHAVLASSQNEEEDDGEDEDEENEEELEDDEGDDHDEPPTKSRKRSADGPAEEEEEEVPLQLVCLWRDCNMTFDAMMALNEHVADVHIGSGKACYTCDWKNCPRMMKPFTKRHKMYNHLRTHTGERPFRCLVPGKIT